MEWFALVAVLGIIAWKWNRDRRMKDLEKPRPPHIPAPPDDGIDDGFD